MRTQFVPVGLTQQLVASFLQNAATMSGTYKTPPMTCRITHQMAYRVLGATTVVPLEDTVAVLQGCRLLAEVTLAGGRYEAHRSMAVLDTPLEVLPTDPCLLETREGLSRPPADTSTSESESSTPSKCCHSIGSTTERANTPFLEASPTSWSRALTQCCPSEAQHPPKPVLARYRLQIGTTASTADFSIYNPIEVLVALDTFSNSFGSSN